MYIKASLHEGSELLRAIRTGQSVAFTDDLDCVGVNHYGLPDRTAAMKIADKITNIDRDPTYVAESTEASPTPEGETRRLLNFDPEDSHGDMKIESPTLVDIR